MKKKITRILKRGSRSMPIILPSEIRDKDISCQDCELPGLHYCYFCKTFSCNDCFQELTKLCYSCDRLINTYNEITKPYINKSNKQII